MPWLVVPFATARAVKKRLATVLNAGNNRYLEVVCLRGTGARDPASPWAPYAKHAQTLVDLHREAFAVEVRQKLKLGACAAWPPPPASNDPHAPFFLSTETVEAQIAKGKPRAPWEGGPHPWSFRDGVVPPGFGIRPPAESPAPAPAAS